MEELMVDNDEPEDSSSSSTSSDDEEGQNDSAQDAIGVGTLFHNLT